MIASLQPRHERNAQQWRLERPAKSGPHTNVTVYDERVTDEEVQEDCDLASATNSNAGGARSAVSVGAPNEMKVRTAGRRQLRVRGDLQKPVVVSPVQADNPVIYPELPSVACLDRAASDLVVR